MIELCSVAALFFRGKSEAKARRNPVEDQPTTSATRSVKEVRELRSKAGEFTQIHMNSFVDNGGGMGMVSSMVVVVSQVP